MTFDDLLAQVLDLVQRQGRVSYSALRRRFDIDDAYLDDLKDELLFSHPVIDEDGRGLVWTGKSPSTSSPAPAPELPSAQARDPLSYTPQYLTEKILTSRSALEGERKQVTVLFADIKDSTELIRDLDPEDAQKLLDPAIHIMMEAVHRFEGTVNQVLGDGIMSLFGAPISHEDHAARACYAALAMQAAMQPYAEEVRRSHGIAMRIRVGLNSGEVVVRTIGNDLHMDYSAVGQTTNLASRMEQLAAPGSVVLSAATLRLVEGLVRVDDLGPVPVKGLNEPVEVYELTGASSIRRRLQAAVARGLSPFVGRDTEIEALNQALELAGSGHGQVVAAVGEAGVGKSRLVYEFVHSHRTQGWLVLESASVSYGKATPYFPVVDLLKRYVHIEEGDDPRTIRAKVIGHILTLDETLQETIPALLSLLDALPEDSPFRQLDPPQRRQRTLDGLKRILLRESQVQPLLLVFEDLHWIDSETQALLDSLVESLPAAQLLLLVNYRPEYQHSWGGKTYSQLRLDPLPPASAETFLAALLGDDSSLAPLTLLLIARTQGNPFFLEESVRTLVETGVLVGTPGAYRLVKLLESLQVPATVQAVLAARIDRLSPEDKRLLQSAAVIGTDVPFALLRAIADLSEAALHSSLAHLHAAEFLYETHLFPEPEYTFKHALTHEVAYGSLLQERRRVLHARIFGVLETSAGDRLSEQVERLAYHAVKGEVWDKAVDYLCQAGDKALNRGAIKESLTRYEQALAILPQLPTTPKNLERAIDIRLRFQRPLFVFGQIPRFLHILEEAEYLARQLNHQSRLGLISAKMSICALMQGYYTQGITTAQQARTIAETIDSSEIRVMATHTLSLNLFATGNYRDALAGFANNVEGPDADLAQRLAATYGTFYFMGCGFLSWGHTILGDFASAFQYADRTTQAAERIESPQVQANALCFRAILLNHQGEFARAIPLCEQAVQLYETHGIRFMLPLALMYWGQALAWIGQSSESLAALERAVALQEDMETQYLATEGYIMWAEGLLLANNFEEAQRVANRGVDLARATGEQGNEAWVLRFLGDIAMHRDSPDVNQAETYYQQALTLANELGMRPLQAHCHRGLGTLYRQTRQLEQARTELSTAIEMYRDMEMTFWLPETEAALATVEGR